jgi:phage terminase large subunit-like protein
VPPLAGRACFPSMDLSTTTDISAVVLTFPPVGDDDPFVILPFFWCPEDKIRKAVQFDRVPYDAWVRDGFIETTPGNVVDYAFIRHRINALSKLYKFGSFPFDPWNATQLATQLREEDGFEMVEHRQGYISMNEASKEFERLVIAKRLLHPDNPVLNWMVSNVSIRRDPAGNIKPDKERSTGRIDGVVAAVMGVGTATRQTPKREPKLFFLGAR